MFHLVQDVDVMDLTNEVHNSLNNYFSALSHTGYKPDKEVELLLVFSFIEELLYGPLSLFVTDLDYKEINDKLYCLYGSCLIPFPSYKLSITIITNSLPAEYRITETNELRSTREDNLRIVP